MNKDEKYVLITGARGQLGHDLVKELESRNIKYLATDYDNLDITDDIKVSKFFRTVFGNCPQKQSL